MTDQPQPTASPRDAAACARSDMTDAEIDDLIDAWHAGCSAKPLHEFLNWTLGEYFLWVREPTEIPKGNPGDLNVDSDANQTTEDVIFAENCVRAQKAFDAVPNEAELQIFLAGIEIEELSDPAITKVLHWLMDIAGLPGASAPALPISTPN